MSEGRTGGKKDLAKAKRHVLRGLLMTDPIVVAWVDVNRKGVVLPDSMKKDLHAKLEYRANQPGLDLQITAVGIGATILVMGLPFRTFVPWAALFTLETENGMAVVNWPEPEEPHANAPRDEGCGCDGACGCEDGPIPPFVANRHGSDPVAPEPEEPKAIAQIDEARSCDGGCDCEDGPIPELVTNVEGSAPVSSGPARPNAIAQLDGNWRRKDGPIPKFVPTVEGSAPVSTPTRGHLKLVD